MIARVRVLLPYRLTLLAGEVLEPFEMRWRQWHVRVYPPFQSRIEATSLDPLNPAPLDRLYQILGEPPLNQINRNLHVNGAATIHADCLQVVFLKEDFDRRRIIGRPDVPPDEYRATGDPSPDEIFAFINLLIGRLRSTTQASRVRPLVASETAWRLDYLNDDESELPADPALFRIRAGRTFGWQLAIVSPATWTAIQRLSDRFPADWETLLLEAEALLPNVGGPIALANAALETLIATTLDQLASGGIVPGKLWEWINHRDHWSKEPSVAEQYDVLLQVLSGESLKDKPDLWEAFQNLRKARNALSHEGRAAIGGIVITPEQARVLVGRAKAIVAWVERLLPEALRRPVTGERFNIEMTAEVATPEKPSQTA